jgi:death-on-curing protein
MLCANWLNEKMKIQGVLEATVLAIHNRQIAEHGGRGGIRDIGLLSSALARAQNILAYKPKADIVELASAYACGITKNHPFIDGNKRTALIVTRTFLRLNGFDIKASQEEKYLTYWKLAEGTLSEKELIAWIRESLVQVSGESDDH